MAEQHADRNGHCDARSGLTTPARNPGPTYQLSCAIRGRRTLREVAVAEGTNCSDAPVENDVSHAKGDPVVFLYSTPACAGRPNALRRMALGRK